MDSSSLDTILRKLSSIELAISSINESHNEMKSMFRDVVMANQQSNLPADESTTAPPPVICKRVDESYVLPDANKYRRLTNKKGEYNSFINVIIQSLWHLKSFRDGFFGRLSTGHVCVGEPCVICALCDIFIALSKTSTNVSGVAPNSLRIALSNLCRANKMFQEGERNDASEVLDRLLRCLHKSFNNVVSSAVGSERESSGWDCNNDSCIAHSVFGMDIVDKMNCCYCGLEFGYVKYTSFFHYVPTGRLRLMKRLFSDGLDSFGKVLDAIEKENWLRCDLNAGGCGEIGDIRHFVCRQPHVFTVVLGWETHCESSKNILVTFAAISTDIDISLLYVNGVNQSRHRLISMVCFFRDIYICFCYSDDYSEWIFYQDDQVGVAGSWSKVVRICGEWLIQPHILFFETVN